MNRTAILLAGLAILGSASASQAGWSVGVRFGPGYGPHYRGWYGPPCYYRPYGVIYAPPPVILVPAPVVRVAPAPVVALSPEQADEQLPAPAKLLPPPTQTSNAVNKNTARNDLATLNDPDAQTRADAIIALGRNRDRQAVAPITRALREDDSPIVRESAARALGLIALPGSLTALQNAAQADKDRDVRRSAAFAADVIRANLKR